MAFFYLVDDGTEFALLGLIDAVGVVDANHGTVCRDLDNIQLVYLFELARLGHGGTRHTGKLSVKPEIVLEGDGGKRLAFALDLDPLLGLNCLMQPLVVATPEHKAAGEFVDNYNLAVLDDVIDVAFHNAACLDCLIYMVQNCNVIGVHQVFQIKKRLGFLNTRAGEGGSSGLFVDDIVGVDIVLFLLSVLLAHPDEFQGFRKLVGAGVKVGGFVPLTRDDKRGARLIDEDRVDLIDYCVVVGTLYLVVFIYNHVVAKIIKAELVVCAVGNIGVVCRLSVLRFKVMHDKSDRKPEITVDLAHPFAVAAGEVIVDGNDMDTLAGKCVEIGRQDNRLGFTFAGFHLGDTALMQYDSAENLNRKVGGSEHPIGRLAADCKRVG